MYSRSHDQPPDDGPRVTLSPPRFSLRTLFWLVTGVGTGLAGWQIVGPVVGLSLLMVGLAIFAHVAGNALGTRLRDGRPQDQAETDGRRPSSERCVEHFAPVTRLSHRVPLGRFLHLMTLLGAITGAGCGWYALEQMYVSTTASTLLVGCSATAVIGALFAFWVFSLLQVFLGAWWQAHKHSSER